MISRSSLVRIAPFALWIVLLAWVGASVSADSALPESLRIGETWSYAVRTLACGALLVGLWHDYVELRAGRTVAADLARADQPSRVLATGIAADPAGRRWLEPIAVGLAVWLLWITVGPLLTLSTPAADPGPPRPDSPIAAGLWLFFRFVGAVLVVPVLEELFWRSYLMRRIDRVDFLSLAPREASWLAVVLSSAVFALAHRELLAAFLSGLIFAWFYRRSGRLVDVVVAHAVSNLALGLYVVGAGQWAFW